jgi:hypothetical protein
MRYRAVVKKEGWWVGWLIDLPGVIAQEKTNVVIQFAEFRVSGSAYRRNLTYIDTRWL